MPLGTKIKTQSPEFEKSFLRLSQLLSPKPTKRDIASFGGTRSVSMPKTGCNWNDGTAEPTPSSGSRTHVLYNVIAPGGRRSFNRSYACCYIWVDGGINALDASACASASAARSAPPPRPCGVGSSRRPTFVSLPPADSRAPAAPWCPSPAA